MKQLQRYKGGKYPGNPVGEAKTAFSGQREAYSVWRIAARHPFPGKGWHAKGIAKIKVPSTKLFWCGINKAKNCGAACYFALRASIFAKAMTDKTKYKSRGVLTDSSTGSE